jgi:hypothetical protein
MKKLTITLLLVASGGWLLASEEDDLTSLSYISYLERYATVQPATQQEGIEAVINMPLVPGDRVDTAREARMEVFLADGNTVWVDEYTTVSLDAVAFSRDGQADRTVLYLAEGTIMVEISDHSLSRQPIRVDGRAATVYLNDIGLYRLEALANGGIRLEVWEGLGEASTSAGGVLVRPANAAEVEAGQVTGTEPHLSWGDPFATWVEQRRQIIKGDSGQYVEARYERQAAQLDNYGSWVYVDNLNTWAWQPTVAADWRPYTAGRWYWTPSGWSWISYEPWGWLPYHYGSWHFSVGFGWVWNYHPYWSPAWVRWAWWPGYVGWCPYGYYDYWYWPRYHHYYGYPRWPYYPSHPGGGGGTAQPARRDVVPPRSAAASKPVAAGQEPSDGRATVRSRASDPTLDLSGRVRAEVIDGSAWNVVSDRDFASPHLSRVVQRGDVALRGRGDQMGVVMSGPLATEPPSRARPSTELERVFRGVEERSPRDLSPVLARSDRLRPEEAMSLVQPTTLADVGGRRATASRPVEPTLNATSTSPMRAPARAEPPAGYRGYTPTTSTLPSRHPTAYRNPFVSRSRPSTPSTPGVTGGSSTGVISRPAPRSTGSRAPVLSPRSPSGSRPVIVPRTSPSQPRPQAGSSGIRTRPSTSARPPTSSSTGRSSRSSSSPSARPSARSSSAPRSSAAPRSSGSSAGSRSGSSGSSSSGSVRRH